MLGHIYGAIANALPLHGVNVRNAMQAHSTPQCLPRGVAWDWTFWQCVFLPSTSLLSNSCDRPTQTSRQVPPCMLWFQNLVWRRFWILCAWSWNRYIFFFLFFNCLFAKCLIHRKQWLGLFRIYLEPLNNLPTSTNAYVRHSFPIRIPCCFSCSIIVFLSESILTFVVVKIRTYFHIEQDFKV